MERERIRVRLKACLKFHIVCLGYMGVLYGLVCWCFYCARDVGEHIFDVLCAFRLIVRCSIYPGTPFH